MMHLPILPILLPFIGAVVLMFPFFNERPVAQRQIALITLLLTLVASGWLLHDSLLFGPLPYALGDWRPPFGILLLADPLAAMMLVLTAVLAVSVSLYAAAGDDQSGRFFHPLFLFQLLGINGAFLTADVFNLFVFFEILLIASYSLLIHGGGRQRTQAALHYVLYNLIGSAFFLIALAILYRVFGTLNLPDMAAKVGDLPSDILPLARAGGLLLLVVFGIKAALLPMHFWLPNTYAATSVPVAALFAIMTKVGVYSMWRFHTAVFGDDAGELSLLGMNWLWPMAILTIVVGSFGVLASRSLRWLAANIIAVSVGTLLLTVAMADVKATAAGVYYTVHSTLLSAALFLLAGLIQAQRGQAGDRFVRARPLLQPRLLGILFAVIAMALVGLPPFSGFIGKVFIMQAAAESGYIWRVWPAILISGLATLIALSRAGTTLFWRTQGLPSENDNKVAHSSQIVGVSILALSAPLLVVFAGPLTDWSMLASEWLHQGVQLRDLSVGSK
ncbi:monovalent cation/H+ antiporter subunit D [Thalassolituus oleivorans]|uniref:monovalent cation/H+ antiporter subunit D n=1 Tax=Thalassolituus oleivorans TaxID=187493 RepID=UPI0009492640|nr:monovalent cation/H+ antiporter subunit D [Thalassolituus oleivorans]APR68334.1 monovalent cation/H+ antiporter subunit D [Thalassolituus oleivorans]